jgi:nucleoid-associated protein YgaU
MPDDEKKKGFFEKTVDMISSRDEKAAATEAAQKAAAAEKTAADAKAEAARLTAEKDTANKAAEVARQEAAAAQNKAQAFERMEQMREMEDMKVRAAAAAEAAAKAALPKIIAEHTTGDETLSGIALKYYGNATRPYWEVIYEVNKAVIGANPNIIRPGLKLQIPELPAALKKS